MTPAETLTAAADLIERLAGNATPGPWSFTRSLGHSLPSGEYPGASVFDVHGDYLCEDLDDATAEHVALWSPGVAILLAPVLRAAVPLSSRGRIDPNLLAFARALIEGASK